jgi:hypothetical protein
MVEAPNGEKGGASWIAQMKKLKADKIKQQKEVKAKMVA